VSVRGLCSPATLTQVYSPGEDFKMLNRTAFIVAAGLVFTGSVWAEEKKTCTYSFENPSLVFTGYKFTEKAGVNGTFKKINARYPKSATSLTELLKGTQFEIDTTSLDTKNPARNMNIVTNFFKAMTGFTQISGRVVKAKKDRATVQIETAGKKGKIRFKHSVSKAGDFVAKGSFDILKFGLEPAFTSIKKACRDLHVGKDGKSKTWSTVDLVISAKVKTNC
jgi:polyisoprenoid-binding protein YceI